MERIIKEMRSFTDACVGMDLGRLNRRGKTVGCKAFRSKCDVAIVVCIMQDKFFKTVGSTVYPYVQHRHKPTRRNDQVVRIYMLFEPAGQVSLLRLTKPDPVPGSILVASFPRDLAGAEVMLRNGWVAPALWLACISIGLDFVGSILQAG